jgi:enterochelin esterase-like enzyme
MVEVEVISTDNLPRTEHTGLLLLNDGQLSGALQIQQAINRLYKSGQIIPVQVIAIHAGERQSEYGVSGTEDYLGRGEKAREYENFIIRELLPWFNTSGGHHYKPQRTAFAGCSLGGLSAFDIAVSNPAWFGTAGVFSGSLWWRSRSYESGYTDSDRIIFNKVAQTTLASHFRCYLLAGTNDENNDRNGNGIIDAVDDTLDLFDLLSLKISRPAKNLHLSIVEGGRHDPVTWSQQFPEFLAHAFGKQN